MSGWLTARAWAELLYIDLIALGGFRATHRLVARTPTNVVPTNSTTLPAVLNAVSTASLFYFKSSLCLQRSVVVTRLLRRRGIAAELVVGYHLPPLEAHAWVEVAGAVVSDHRDDLDHFCVLDRW